MQKIFLSSQRHLDDGWKVRQNTFHLSLKLTQFYERELNYSSFFVENGAVEGFKLLISLYQVIAYLIMRNFIYNISF